VRTEIHQLPSFLNKTKQLLHINCSWYPASSAILHAKRDGEGHHLPFSEGSSSFTYSCKHLAESELDIRSFRPCHFPQSLKFHINFFEPESGGAGNENFSLTLFLWERRMEPQNLIQPHFFRIYAHMMFWSTSNNHKHLWIQNSHDPWLSSHKNGGFSHKIM